MIKQVGIISLCNWVRRFSALLLVLLPLTGAYVWWSTFDAQAVKVLGPHVAVHFESVQWYQWVSAIVLSFIPVLLLIWAITHVYRLMGIFREAEYFTHHTSHHLHQFSFWLLMSTLAKIITDALMSGLLTMNNPSGGMIAVGLDSKAVSTIFVASIFFVITRIMKEGVKLAEENAEFV